MVELPKDITEALRGIARTMADPQNKDVLMESLHGKQTTEESNDPQLTEQNGSESNG